MSWIILTFLAFLFWGLWAFFEKVGTKYLDPASILIYETLGIIVVTLFLLISVKFKVPFNSRGAFFAFASGIVATIATIFFLFALTKGKVSVVVLLTSLYPLVTIILSILFLKEKLDFREVAGIMFALIAIGLLAK